MCWPATVNRKVLIFSPKNLVFFFFCPYGTYSKWLAECCGDAEDESAPSARQVLLERTLDSVLETEGGRRRGRRRVLLEEEDAAGWMGGILQRLPGTARFPSGGHEIR